MADHLDFEKLRNAITKALKMDGDKITITISRKQTELLKSHLDYEIRQIEDFYICDR